MTVVKRETMAAQICEMMRAAILAGEFAPGETVTETALAVRFGASRAPMREALRQLIDQGLVVSVPYTGTRIVDLSVKDINDIYSMRICLEVFAFEQIWDRRTLRFEKELRARHERLLNAIDAQDDVRAIDAELDLHGLSYEWSGNSILASSWSSVRGRLQVYWAAHHRAHGISGPKRDSHDEYIRLALSDDLETMKAEIQTHMRRGLETTKAFVDTLETTRANPSRSKK
ncbi:GntR family transcriptional regulator [Paracoccus liaowanqingii]|nr:GntR family transcriptional regulator [Paracoccus liaowanqingii]